MAYNIGYEGDGEMTKPGLAMSEEQVDKFIKKSRDEQRMSFPDIADKLKSMGYKSRKNGKFLAAQSVRFRYYNGNVGPEQMRAAAEVNMASGESDIERKLSLIETTLGMKVDDKSKIALITEIVRR
jgi:hypothetical protein